MNRRDFFLKTSAAAASLGLFPLARALRACGSPLSSDPTPVQPFKISLAEWSLNHNLFAKKLDNLDFPRYAKKEFGIDTVEYVDQFFKDQSRDMKYLGELKKRCDGEGVRSGLIMVDTAGELAGPGREDRQKAVENHQAWIDAARFLGCHTVRVNAWGKGAPAELHQRMVESGGKLAEHGAKLGLNVVIENHGGESSDGDWLLGVIREINSPWFGILPDFGNFEKGADRYAAVEKWMPHARAVSAKAGHFDARGNETEIDYPRMMKIVLDSGYRGYVGIETEVETPEEEPQAIRFTKKLLEEARSRLPALKPIFNGRDLAGWVKVAGGDWSVEEGVLVARNGVDWSTDPSRTGSWLRTEKEYGDFELYLEYTVKPRSNSGIFIRSLLERNPAFTGYEMQIFDAPGVPPTKTGPCSLYAYAAPSKNLVRPAGEWNEVRVIARGPSIRVHVNGQMVIDTRGDRSPRGYLGLQNHDARSESRFRNVQVAEL